MLPPMNSREISALSPNPLTALDEAHQARHADRDALRVALAATRARLMRLWDAYRAALAADGWQVRYLPELNPPLWELGHVAWFDEFWIARNPLRALGSMADPDAARAASCLPRADALYHSSLVPHARRWHLSLPDERSTLNYANEVRQRTLRLLAQTPNTDADADAELYFYRLVLHHEDMHGEAWANTAQTLGFAIGHALNEPIPAGEAAVDAIDQPKSVAVNGTWCMPAQRWLAGSTEVGFVFDNEVPALAIELPAYEIDRAPVTWGQYLPFIEAGGYDDARWWTAPGWAWRQRHGLARPRHLSRDELGGWQRAVFGRWQAVDPQTPVVHLTAHEAQAWCQWAGRRLPTEFEWEAAAVSSAAAHEPFDWGQVWEWTASAFEPYAGFRAHPYADYSAPWFDGRPVLRGASFATSARLKHPRYRNYFPADRNDVFAGFRTCTL